MTSIIISIIAVIFGIMAFIFSVINFIELKAMQKSTHQIQMVPVDEFGKVQGQVQSAVKDQMSDDLDNII